jgi:hypothetical protein
MKRLALILALNLTPANHPATSSEARGFPVPTEAN